MATLEVKPSTKRSFREEIVCSSPRNAVLVPDSVLICALNGTSAERRIARAELAVRYYLSPGKKFKDAENCDYDIAAELHGWIGADAFVDFIAQCQRCESCAAPEQQAERAFSMLGGGKCRLAQEDVGALRLAFLPWLTADGVIPVFNSSAAYLLPFSFDSKQVKMPRVLDWRGKEFEVWTAAIRRMDVGIDRDIRVAIDKTDGVKDSGNSLMLPVLMAWWRNRVGTRERLPRYSPIRFIATGAFEGGRVGDVQTEEKEAKIQDVDKGFLVRPGTGLRSGSVPVGSDLPKAIECIREIAELRSDAEPANAGRRLVELDAAVRRGRHEGWETLIRRLDRLWGVQNPDVDDESYLQGLMLRSAARCHAGRTEEALKLNCEAMDKARGNPRFLPQLLRLRIEELVLLEDEEDFPRTFALAADLEKDIGEFAALEKDSDRALDLQMRFHGTMGQAVAYASLSGSGLYSSESAKGHFESAYRHAVELARRSIARTGDEEETDDAFYNCGHDANYLLLWAALFATDDIPQMLKKAKRFAERSHNDGATGDALKNDRYRHRYTALGLYRAVLAGHPLTMNEELSEIEEEVDAKDCDPWIRATIGKYLGAIAAAHGDVKGACKWFCQAAEELAGAKYFVFQVIHMTILAEAYRSLRRMQDCAGLAEDMREKALAVFDSADDAELWIRKKDNWRMWLMEKGEDDQFPGLQYWY